MQMERWSMEPVCVSGEWFLCYEGTRVSSGERGQSSYKCLMFALYIAAAHTGM